MKIFKKKIEFDIVSQTYILIFIGLILLFSASKGVITRFEGIFIRQFLWIIFGSIIFIFVKKIDYRNYRRFSLLLYFLILFFLVLVLIIGQGRASRWIKIGWFYFQPSEFAKLISIITLSSYLTEKDPKKIGVFITSFIITGIPLILILKQPNLGTAFIFLIITLGILYEANFSKKQLFYLILAGIILSPVFWFSLKDYQKERILTFLNPQKDPVGTGYNLIQSKITVGSGGLIGKGFLHGTQTKLAFLPEYHTDFIFCLLAEEFGFIGVIILLWIYYNFLKNILKIVYLTQDRFAKLVGIGIFVMFLSQTVINIGMAIGIFPVVGIPLLFISYGGSSMLVSLISIGILLNIKENSTMI